MTSAVHKQPAGTHTKPLWAAVAVLGVAVLAFGASLIYVQNRPLDGHAALAALAASSLSDATEPSRSVITPAQQVVCTGCGRVEAVTPVERKGAPQDVSAVGGGVASNTIEKSVSKETVYQVSVRMDGGSLRTVEQSTLPAIGAAVVVDGNTLRLQQTGAGVEGTSALPPLVPLAKVYSTERR